MSKFSRNFQILNNNFPSDLKNNRWDTRNGILLDWIDRSNDHGYRSFFQTTREQMRECHLTKNVKAGKVKSNSENILEEFSEKYY